MHFIELYRAHLRLWKVKRKDFKAKHKKNHVYDSLMEKKCGKLVKPKRSCYGLGIT